MGTVVVETNGFPLHSMVAFTLSGQLLWSVPNDTPQIATADGGVLGASGTTYDQNGNVTGQIGNVPIKGWFGDSYRNASSTQSLVPAPVDPATSFSAFQGGSPSNVLTAAQDVFRLGGPTLVKYTFNGVPWTECPGAQLVKPGGPPPPPGQIVRNSDGVPQLNWFGYEECAYYTLLDHGNPPKPLITWPGTIGIRESFADTVTSANLINIPIKHQNGETNGFVVGDQLALGQEYSPLPSGSYILQQQTLSVTFSSATVRVNCLDQEVTDATLTDITDSPGVTCIRHAH